MRYLIFGLALGLLAACKISQKGFKHVSAAEAAAVKAARRQWHSHTDADRFVILTSSGSMVVRLYNQTPLHRDNFIRLAETGFFDSLLFHRVINHFMIQGGDPNSKHAAAAAPLGDGEAPGKPIDAEIRTAEGLYHKKGVLAAARDDNPTKASSNCQFYIVQGKVFSPATLSAMATQRKLVLTDAQQKLYTTLGGTPHLDGKYTVFGELESGLEVLDKIASVKTDTFDRPLTDVRMRIYRVSRRKK